jgi:hypothetical protein
MESKAGQYREGGRVWVQRDPDVDEWSAGVVERAATVLNYDTGIVTMFYFVQVGAERVFVPETQVRRLRLLRQTGESEG